MADNHKSRHMAGLFQKLDLEEVAKIVLGEKSSKAIEYYTNDGVVIKVSILLKDVNFVEGVPATPPMLSALAAHLSFNGWDTEVFGNDHIHVVI